MTETASVDDKLGLKTFADWLELVRLLLKVIDTSVPGANPCVYPKLPTVECCVNEVAAADVTPTPEINGLATGIVWSTRLRFIVTFGSKLTRLPAFADSKFISSSHGV